FLGGRNLVQITLGLFWTLGGIQCISIIKVKAIPFRVRHGTFIHLFVPFERVGIFSRLKIVIGHIQKSGIPFGGSGIALHKILHHFIGSPLVQSNSGIGGIIGAVGLRLAIL